MLEEVREWTERAESRMGREGRKEGQREGTVERNSNPNLALEQASVCTHHVHACHTPESELCIGLFSYPHGA